MSDHIKNYYLFYIVIILLALFFSRTFIFPKIFQQPSASIPTEVQKSSASGILENQDSSEDYLKNTNDNSQDLPKSELKPIDNQQPKEPAKTEPEEVKPETVAKYVALKDVGEPYLDRFGLSPADFNRIKEAGIDIIEPNFDICATPSDVVLFLDGAKDAGLKVIMTAGAGEAEWGYPCNEIFGDILKPQWQKDEVQAWVKEWAYHPAIYAWDISNEDGQNFPNAERVGDNWAQEGYAVSVAQLQQAYKDVKAADPTRPIMIRMNGWYFYDYDSNFFRTGNAFGPNVADIVMVNAYSNVDEYYSNLVATVASRAHDAIRSINPSAKIIVALGAWQEPPMWVKPSLMQFSNDVVQAQKTKDLLGIAVFKYGAEESEEWWMPRDALELWNFIKTGVLK